MSKVYSVSALCLYSAKTYVYPGVSGSATLVSPQWLFILFPFFFFLSYFLVDFALPCLFINDRVCASFDLTILLARSVRPITARVSATSERGNRLCTCSGLSLWCCTTRLNPVGRLAFDLRLVVTLLGMAFISRGSSPLMFQRLLRRSW